MAANWRNAFLSQARHDYAQYRELSRTNAAFSDQLHYMQMSTEKLARGYLANPASVTPPDFTHAGIVKMFQHLKGDIAMRRLLGYTSSRQFSTYIDSLLDIAMKVQSLAPAIAGASAPNPEYPWMDAGSDEIQVPFKFAFSHLNEFKNARASRFLKLVDQLFQILAHEH